MWKGKVERNHGYLQAKKYRHLWNISSILFI